MNVHLLNEQRFLFASPQTAFVLSKRLVVVTQVAKRRGVAGGVFSRTPPASLSCKSIQAHR